MASNLPVNRLSHIPHPATGIATQTGATTESRKQSGNAQAAQRDPGGISVKVERHGRWAIMSSFQAQLSAIQSADQAIVAAYRELSALARQLNRTVTDGQALTSKVAGLREQLEQGKQLDNNLKLQQTPARTSYLLERVDLLSPRDQSEQLGLQLPNSASVTLKLEAGATREQNLQQLREAFSKHGLAVEAVGRNLRIQGQESLLSSPWVFKGQGVRVPAGNPVPIQLSKEPSELAQLENGIHKGEHEHEKQRIRRLIETLEQERRVLETRREQLVRGLARINLTETQTTSQASDASANVRDVLRDGDFMLQLSTLLAQANVSRSFVVALLGR